jgi:hypothetical protein
MEASKKFPRSMALARIEQIEGVRASIQQEVISTGPTLLDQKNLILSNPETEVGADNSDGSPVQIGQEVENITRPDELKFLKGHLVIGWAEVDSEEDVEQTVKTRRSWSKSRMEDAGVVAFTGGRRDARNVRFFTKTKALAEKSIKKAIKSTSLEPIEMLIDGKYKAAIYTTAVEYEEDLEVEPENSPKFSLSNPLTSAKNALSKEDPLKVAKRSTVSVLVMFNMKSE